MIKTFEEFINESKMLPFDKLTAKELYDYLVQNYEVLGDNEIGYAPATDGSGEDEVDIPVTLDGKELQLEPSFPNKFFSIDIPPELEQYAEPGTYDEIEDANLSDGWLRVYGVNGDPTNTEIVAFLDGILKNVPNPALKKR